MKRLVAGLGILVMTLLLPAAAQAQTSSLGKRAARHEPLPPDPNVGVGNELMERRGNPLLEESSLIAIKVRPPKEFQVNDIITIIVRQQKRFEAEAELDTKKKFDIQSELEAFFKLIDGGLGATTFYRGKPNVDYKFGARLKSEGDNSREDTFVTRISGTIVDVKPNGNLVVEASSKIVHEQESAMVTLTGECRSSDVTPDNTILSTQLARLNIKVDNQGAVRDATTRGWILRLLDLVKPF